MFHDLNDIIKAKTGQKYSTMVQIFFKVSIIYKYKHIFNTYLEIRHEDYSSQNALRRFFNTLLKKRVQLGLLEVFDLISKFRGEQQLKDNSDI